MHGVVLGMKPRVSCVLDKCSTIELWSQPHRIFLLVLRMVPRAPCMLSTCSVTEQTQKNIFVTALSLIAKR